jgi:segregation and condensation protein B
MKLMDTQRVKRVVEAALFAATQPLSPQQLSELFADGEPIGSEAIAQVLEELAADYAERGVELIEVASGFRFQVRHDVHRFVSRLWTERQTKYSRALLETLALIAYRQPITRAEIEQIRGVAVSSNIIRTLEEREWVRVVGHRDVPGKPALFGTTRVFLDYFNLKSLDQLPPLSEIRDLEELELDLGLPAADETAAREPPAVVEAANDAENDA